MEAARNYHVEQQPQSDQEIQGFNLDLEMRSILRRYKRGEDLLSETRGNVYGWVSEYVLALKVFKNPVGLDENGHLVNSISGVRLVDIIDPNEREGKPLQAVAAAEKKLADSESGGVVVIASPLGTSQDQDGNMIHFKYTQIGVFEKRKDQIDAITIVIDNDLGDNQKLLENLGNTQAEVYQGQTEYERTCHVAGIVAFLPAERGFGLEAIVEELDRARSENNHSLEAEIKQSLQDGVINRENGSIALKRANRITALYFGKYEQFILANQDDLDNEFTCRRVRAELKSTLEKITHEIKFGKQGVEDIVDHSLTPRERSRTYDYLSSLSGCNDNFGGRGIVMVDGPLGLRSAYSNAQQNVVFLNGEYYLWFNGEMIKGVKCKDFNCGKVIVCGDRCPFCRGLLPQNITKT